MKNIQKAQKNETLFVGRVKILSANNKTYVTKIERTMKIDLNGARLYKCASNSIGNSLNKEKLLNSLDAVQMPVSSFPILPESEVYQISPSDTAMDDYLKQLNQARQKSQHICLFCNTKDSTMFPLFFDSQPAAEKFHAGVLVFQLYHKYYPGFVKLCEEKNLAMGMNMRLLESLANSAVRLEVVIDPEELSVVELEDFELRIIRDSIERLAKKGNLRQGRISTTNSAIHSSTLSQKPPLFSLHLRYKIVDQVSLNYLPTLLPQQILHRNIKELYLINCSINDRILAMMLRQEGKGMGQGMGMGVELMMYRNLVKLDLRGNQITDVSFVALAGFVGVAPRLMDLGLAGNLIKLQSLASLKREDKENGRLSKVSRLSTARMSTNRLSTQLPQSLFPKSSPLFIQFLLSLQHRPLNYLSLDNNLIEQPLVLVSYLIQGENVPLKYLSVRGNRLSEVDKIRMAKLIVSQVRERDGDQIAVLDFGEISVVDQDVYRYVMLVRDKAKQLGLEQQAKTGQEDPQRRRSTNQISSLTSLDLKRLETNQPNVLKISLTLNKEWQMCDQEGMLQVSNLYKNRRKTTMRRSQIVNNIIMGSSLSPSNSSASLKREERIAELDHITAENVKPTVLLLKEAYLAGNFSAVHIYKSLLQDYNMELYTKKISPMFVKHEQSLKREQQDILRRLDGLINFQKTEEIRKGELGVEKFNQKLDGLITKLFLRRVDNQVKPTTVLYEDDIGQEYEINRPLTTNVFTFLLYLREKRDRLIEKMIAEGYNPLAEITKKLIASPDLYNDYYRAHHDWLCEDNYQQLLQSLIKQKQKQSETQPESESKSKQQLGPATQKQINQLIREKYLSKSRVVGRDPTEFCKWSQEEIWLCALEPKLMFTGYLVKFYSQRYIPKTKTIVNGMLPKLKCQLQVTTPSIGPPIDINITNFLSFISSHDLLSSPPLCINPTIAPNELPSSQSLKLSIYNPSFQPALQKFSQLVIAFVKFLHHSPTKMLPQTLQYLNYLINIVLSEEDSFNVECMGSEFFIQLFTYNASLDAEERARQVDAGILVTLVEFVSLYMPYTEMLEQFIIAHVLRAEMSITKSNKNSQCRALSPKAPHFTQPHSQLPPEVVTHIFTTNLHAQQNELKNGLMMAIEIYYQDPAEEGLGIEVVHMHLLSRIQEVYREVERVGLPDRIGVAVGEKGGNCNWGLFLRDTDTHKVSLLLPSTTQQLTLYTLYRTHTLTPPSTPKKHFLVLPLTHALHSPLTSSTNQQQLHNTYKQIYSSFRQYGSYLPMIQQGEGEGVHIVNIVVECMLCELLLAEREGIMGMVEGGEGVGVEGLVGVYGGKLEEYCPKGTAATLSSQQKHYIEQLVQKQLQQILQTLQNPEHYYTQILHTKLSQFHTRCRLISHSTTLYSPLSQQELLFTSHGLVRISKTIYVQAIEWRDVWDIGVQYGEDGGGLRAVEIRGRDGVGDGSGGKRIRVEGVGEDRVFVGACLIMLRNLGLKFVRAPRGILYRHVSRVAGLDDEQPDNTMEEKQKMPARLPTIWQQLSSTLQYLPASQKQPINLQKPQTEPTDSPQHQPAITAPQMANTENTLKPALQTSQLESQPQPKPTLKADPIREQLDIGGIVGKAGEKDQQEGEEVVITNARRSSRRELPRRRSSRQK